MAKRNAGLSDEDNSDHDGTQSSPTSCSSAHKRARHASPLPGSSPPPLPSADDLEFDPVEEEEQDEQSGDDMIVEDDEEERARMEEDVHRMRSQKKKAGEPAKSGVIEQVFLQNFMCHRLCDIPFGPQINFLVGMNGSGKSAVLTGISMALGGNAKATNRAGKGSGLVQDGASYAICSVKIKNQGTDAFRAKDYGKSIFVERRINSDMGGGYKIKNADGKTVDTKKATLDAILDHFNIQVDNPMTVLTQDQSRQFLAQASAKDKYNFFLRGTQLAQLTEEYEVIRANTEAMQAALDKKRGVIPELKEAYKRAKARATEAQAAVGQKDRKGQLENELTWAYVAEVEDHIRSAGIFIDKEHRTSQKIQEAVDLEEAKVMEAEDSIATIEEALQELNNNTSDRSAELAELSENLSKTKAQLKSLHDDERKGNSEKTSLEARIQSYDKQIAEETAKLERNANKERQPILDKIESLRDQVSKAMLEVGREGQALEEADDEYRNALPRLSAIKDDMDGAHRAIQNSKGRINNLNATRKNVLIAYHDKMPQLVEAIKMEKTWRKTPIGPIGRMLTLQDPRYTKSLESVFGQTLNAFVVEHEQDKRTLINLSNRVNCNVPIIKQAFDRTFDCSGGEPAENILTIRRVLKIAQDAEILDQVLVTSLHIERAALVIERPHGDQLMRANHHNVETCFSADGFRLGARGGGSASMGLDDWKGAPRLNPDVSDQVAYEHEELQKHQRALEDFVQQKRDMDSELSAIEQRKKGHERKRREMQKRVTQINNEIQAQTDKLRDEEPTNLAAIEEMKKSVADDLETLISQFDGIKSERARLGEVLKPLVERRNAIDAEASDVAKKSSKMTSRLEGEVKKKAEADDHVRQFKQKLDVQQQKINQLQADLVKAEAELQTRTTKASQSCARPEVEKKKTIKKLQTEIESLEKALKEREKRQGASLEQILDQLAERKRTAEEAMKSTNDIAKLIQVLSASYSARVDRWTDFRDQIAARAKLQFLFHLSARGFTGKLQFDHDKLRLNLRVQTDDISNGTSQNRQKDAKSLSGGEKSFSTICLLLTMWEAVGCPLRCLDEFDVFMDAVNRKISMKMMVDTAKAADGTQFILITPQSMSDLKWGPEVRVHRMADPARDQGTLGFGA